MKSRGKYIFLGIIWSLWCIYLYVNDAENKSTIEPVTLEIQSDSTNQIKKL